MNTAICCVLLSCQMLGACSSVAERKPEYALSSECRVHGAEFGVVLVPVGHGGLNTERVPGYEAARETLFPNAVVPQLGGRPRELTLEEHCLDCTCAEVEWLWAAFDGVMSSNDALLPTFYELAPGTQLPITVEVAPCGVHATGLEVVLSPVAYGCGIPIDGYREAEARLFPNAMTPRAWGGAHEISFVVHCPACTVAERAWVEQQLGPASFHPFYNVPPNTRLQRTGAVAPTAEPQRR